MDTIPHEYAHHYIRMFIHTAIVQDAIRQFGSEEALVQAIGEQAVKQEGKAWGWWNQFISWLKEKFDANTKEDKERLKNLLTDAFLTRKNLNEVSYKANLDLKLRTQSVFFQTTGSNILKPGDIVFGHPAIGKTYSLKHGKYKDKIIDWDVEFNPKRDKWIEEHSNTKKGTEEYKKARNEYLIYPEKYPDYVEFVTTEWNRVKQKARTENKILFASPHNLLKMFPQDFNRIINIEDEDFIKRNVNRGGGEKESRLWKEGINNTISNITNIPIDRLTEDQYFEDYLDKYLGISEKIDEKSGPFQNIDKLSKVYEKIITGLRGRLASLNRRSTLKDQNTLNELSNVIDLLATLEAKDGVIAFIDHVNDTINISKLFLSKKTSDINSKQLIQLKRDYLGFYTPMVKSLKDILDTTELLNDIPEAEEFKSTVDNLLLTLETLNNKYNLILETKTKEFVINYATDAGSPFVNDLVEWLDNPSNDISFLGYFVGLSSSTNNEMIRIMENIIRNQKNITDMETLYEGKNIIALLNEAKKSYGVDIMSALQEFSKNGKRTGYFVRDRNYGMFHDALSKELERLAQKYNLEKGSDGKYMLPEDTVELRRYTKELNKWYAKHADRRYVPEYYEHKNRILSQATIEAQSNIQKRINQITNNITRDGIVREDLLTDSQLDELDRLYAERKNLSNLYNFDGSRKTGEDLDIALELREFNELVNENVKYKTDYDKFNKARNLMIEKYGKDSPEFKKWVSRNVVQVYTDEFWQLLDKLQAPTFATKEDQELHDELVGRRRELHKLYRKRNSLEIDVTKLNEDEIQMLKELDIKIASLRQYVKVDDDSLTFKDVAKIVNTKEYYKVYQQKQQEAQAKNDPSIFTDWYEANHYEDRRGKMHPVSVWTYIQPVNDTHITYQPSSKWSEPDLSNSSWINKDYEVNSEEAIQPKKALYDNSDAFNKIKNNKEAFALYNALIDSMDRSLSKLSFLTHSNKYRLPQMTARTMQMVGRESNIFKGLGYMVKDEFTIKDDDKDYVPTFDRRPDGSLIKLIPTRYLKPLDDPSMISADTVGSVIEFFNMAENYKQMSKVKDDLEMLLDRMSQLEYNKDNKFKAAGTLNVFKKAESLLDMHLYGKRKNQVEATILGKKINITKALSKIYGVAGTINLAFNMWAMATNAITGKGYTVMESTLGRYFNKQDFAWAEKNYYNSLPNIMKNLGNPNDTTKLMFMCQLNQVARSNQETFSNLDQSPVLRAINQHFWYNGYTAGDFAVKSTILGAVYHSYRLVTTPDGTKQFMTREDYVSKYYANAPQTGRTKFDEFDVTLYDVYEQDKNTYKVKDEYRQYVTVNLTNMVKNKIQTISARIDGNINDTDRAAIHANAYAQFLVMHRNFMIVGLQDRFKKTQFNYNTGAVEEGIYRSIPKLFDGAFSDGMFNVIHNMIQNYHNMKDYEQYAVRKVITELGTILGVSLLVSLLLVPLADDTDDDWALEALTYVAMRTAFEFRTLYQPLELTALLNSPSAAFSSITNAAEMLKLIWIPNYFSDNSSPFKQVSTGAYKGMPKLLRNFIKVTPFKNVIEASDPKAKRKYLDNQLAF